MVKIRLGIAALLVPMALYGVRIVESNLSQYGGGGISACTAIAAAAADDILGVRERGIDDLRQADLEGFVRRGVQIFQELGKKHGDPVDVKEVPLRFSELALIDVPVGFVGENPYGSETGMLTRDDIYHLLANRNPACGLYIRQGATYLLCHKHGKWLFADSHARADGHAGSHMILFDSDGDFQRFLATDYRFQPVAGASSLANQFALHVLEPRTPVAPHAAAGPASGYPAQMRDLQEKVNQMLARYDRGDVLALECILQIGDRMSELRQLAAQVRGGYEEIEAVAKRYEQLADEATREFMAAADYVSEQLIPGIKMVKSLDALQMRQKQFPPFLRDKKYYELLGVMSEVSEDFDDAVREAEARLQAAAPAQAARVHSRSAAEFMQREREIYDTIDSMVTLRELNAASDYLHEGLRLYDRQLSREQKRLVAAALDRISEWMAQLIAAGMRE